MNQDPDNNPDKEAYRLAYLIAGYIRNTLTDAENQELDDWVNASDHNMLLFEDLTDERNIEANLKWMDRVQTDHSFRKLKRSGAFVKPLRRKTRTVWMAAASVVIVVAAFLVYRFSGDRQPASNGSTQLDTSLLQPGTNRATLTLSDGSVIDLNATSIGIIKQGEGSHVSKPVDGELVYEQNALAVAGNKFHTLSTPVGGQYQVTLQDGTKVWLNAASRLTYPSQFTNGERRVTLEGEAYFEVAKNEAQPFRVVLNDSTGISVLGTHFNVMSYDNESAKEIALVEGRIRVTKENNSLELTPGMQANVDGSALSKVSSIDIDEVTGWKNGMFVFHDAPIEAIMRQVERWYDAKVVYQGEIKQQFNASIKRSEPLSQLLKLLQLTKHVKFKIENKTIYVLPG